MQSMRRALFAVVGVAAFAVVRTSCGCFGTPDTPPTATHVVVNLVVAAVGFAFATGRADSLQALVGDQPLAGLPLVLAVAACAWFGYLLLAVLPTVRSPRAAA